jgi:type 1 glutamine amidotransferase
VKQLTMIGIALLTITVLAAPAAAQDDPVTCLMMGTASHRGDTMTEVVADLHARYPGLRITITTDLEDLRYENLQNYDVLCLNRLPVEEGDPPDYIKESITQFLTEGGGLVASHFAVASVQNWRDSIHILGAMWVNGKTFHKPYREFQVNVEDANHPIVEGVDSFMTNDELYYNLLTRPDTNIVLSANEELFGDSIAYPMLATHTFYGARCVYMVFGHDAQSVATPEYRQILAQSIEWAAGRR